MAAWSTKKKWLVGCGGCLSVLLVVLIGFLIGLNWMGSVSGDSVKMIFGEKAPEHYNSFGLQYDQTLTDGKKEKQAFVILVSDSSSVMIMALTSALESKVLHQLQTEDAKSLKGNIDELLGDAVSKSSNQVKMDKLDLEGVNQMNLPNGKAIRVFQLRATDRKGRQIPAAMSMVTLDATREPQKVAFLIALDLPRSTSDKKKDFGQSYARLSGDLSYLIMNTRLAGLLGGGSGGKSESPSADSKATDPKSSVKNN